MPATLAARARRPASPRPPCTVRGCEPWPPRTRPPSCGCWPNADDDLAGECTRILNRLHSLLRDLIPGGAPTDLTADKTAALLRVRRPATATAACRRELARDLLSDLRRLDSRLSDNMAQLGQSRAATGTTLTQVHGLGVILAAKLLGHVGDLGRFPSHSHFASYTATAPLNASSGTSNATGPTPAPTATSTPPCTPSRSATAATPDPAAATTCANSSEARTQPRPAEHSSDAWPTASTGPSSATNTDTSCCRANQAIPCWGRPHRPERSHETAHWPSQLVWARPRMLPSLSLNQAARPPWVVAMPSTV